MLAQGGAAQSSRQARQPAHVPVINGQSALLTQPDVCVVVQPAGKQLCTVATGHIGSEPQTLQLARLLLVHALTGYRLLPHRYTSHAFTRASRRPSVGCHMHRSQ